MTLPPPPQPLPHHITVAAKFDTLWGKQFYEHVMLLVRDIANPSPYDPFFPTFRHKDWFLGFSWASGVVTIEGKPYPNGRNEESSSGTENDDTSLTYYVLSSFISSRTN